MTVLGHSPASPDAGIFEEPACDHNRTKSASEKKAGCPRPKPGATAGGCSFDGAMITLAPIADAAHVVHGPSACSGNSWDGRGSLTSGPDIYKHGFTSDLSETDIVFGGEQKLYDTILEAARRHSPKAVFVYSTCVTATIGDDLEAVCRAAGDALGIAVVPVLSPGFSGSKNLGNRLAADALRKHVIGTIEPPARQGLHVNLIGEYNIAGELWQIEALLAQLGINVHTSISGDARYAEVASAHRSQLSMVVCSRALLGLARDLKDRYGIDYFEGSFYGIDATSQALRDFAIRLDSGDGSLIARADDLIEREEAKARAALAPYRERLAGRRAVLYTGGNKSWSVIGALQDIGIQVMGSGATKATTEDVMRMEEIFGPEGKVISSGGPAELLRIMRETGASLLVAGGRNQYTALKGRFAFLDINQERHIPYACYEGVVEMARRVDLSVNNPVWDQVCTAAPWEVA